MNNNLQGATATRRAALAAWRVADIVERMDIMEQGRISLIGPIRIIGMTGMGIVG